MLGIRVDNLTKDEVREKIASFLRESKMHQIATINPEFVLKAQEDEEFKNILNSCDLNISDGIGLSLGFWKKRECVKARVPGADLMMGIMEIARAQKLRIFVAVREDGLSHWDDVKKALRSNFEDLDVSGADLDANTRNYTIDNIDIILCNFGAPDQEKFLKSIKSDTVRLAIGVGGSLDFLTGKVRRAPSWMCSLGVEWLFRLIQQPRRIKRIWNAVIIFPIKIIFSK